MKIAVIGWGSLIWNKRELQIAGGWHKDGPRLPVEFARISSRERLTLVIHPDSPGQQTYWAASTAKELDAARKNLQAREGTKIENIRSTSLRTAPTDEDDLASQEIHAWLSSQHHDLYAAIWTGLTSNWVEKRK